MKLLNCLSSSFTFYLCISSSIKSSLSVCDHNCCFGNLLMKRSLSFLSSRILRSNRNNNQMKKSSIISFSSTSTGIDNTNVNHVSNYNVNKEERTTFRGIVFDMDGTLTQPSLDFNEMYRRCDVDPKSDIIQVLDTLSKDGIDVSKKWDIIHEMENDACRTMILMPGVIELMEWLNIHQIPTAVVTRNTYSTVEALMKLLHGHQFDFIIARDNITYPPKPNPAALLHIMKEWNISRQIEDDVSSVDGRPSSSSSSSSTSIMMVGDSLKNDITFGVDAGTMTTWLNQHSTKRNDDMTDHYDTIRPNITISHLYQLPSELWKVYNIDSPFGTSIPPLKYPMISKPSHPMTIAAYHGDLSSIQSWVQQNNDNNDNNQNRNILIDETTNTPLIWASDQGHVHVVEYLLKQQQKYNDNHHFINGDIDHQGYTGATALSRAVCHGHINIIKILCEVGANVNISNDKYQTPLHIAAFKENIDCVQILLHYNANRYQLDRKGRTPAYDTKNNEIREIILSTMS